MNQGTLKQAFRRYQAKPRAGARSAMTEAGHLVISCWYSGFKAAAEASILTYEENLEAKINSASEGLRSHITEAFASQCQIRAIVASTSAGPSHYYSREDLIGRVSAFAEDRFVIEFMRMKEDSEPKASKRKARR